MPDSQNSRVAVYLDFDNIVISWYDRVHGRNSYGRDRQRIIETPEDPEIAERLAAATIDVGAIIDYAASLGTLVLTRAYADWSSPVNAVYRSQLVARAVDLVQLFPAAAYAKNGADIRLAVDAVEDMFRLPDLTHVVIVAGDSDYVPLAQRCRRLGRYVVGVGVAGSTAKSLAAACDEFEAYDSLPGVPRPVRTPPTKDAAPRGTAKNGGRAKASSASDSAEAASDAAAPADAGAAEPAPRTRGGRGGKKQPAKQTAEQTAEKTSAEQSADRTAPPQTSTPDAVTEVTSLFQAPEPVATARRTNRRASSSSVAAAAAEDPAADESAEDPQDVATRLLERALRLGRDKDDDAEWLHSSAVKTHMRRMDPSFSEKALGYRSFSDFLKARESIAELEETGHERLVRLRE
jgi:hypothetical protein